MKNFTPTSIFKNMISQVGESFKNAFFSNKKEILIGAGIILVVCIILFLIKRYLGKGSDLYEW